MINYKIKLILVLETKINKNKNKIINLIDKVKLKIHKD
jgi:hypothetical protein